MSGAVLLAFGAGACAVLAAWDALAAIEARAWRPARALAQWLAPLRAGREATPVERRRLALVAAGTLCASGYLVAGPVAAVALGTAGPLAARAVLAARAARRREEVARGAPAAARAIADALGGGHSVRGALVAASRVVEGAAGDELRRAASALALGEPTEAVLAALRARARAPAWDTLTAAVLLQAQAGGDLAALLRDLAARLEQARRDEADARSATAQARFTAWMVAALPAGAAVLAELAAPGFLAELASGPLTGALVAASLVLQLTAVAAIRRIARATHAA